MRRLTAALLLTAALCSPALAAPLEVANTHPLFIGIPAPLMHSVDTGRAAALTLSYGSTFVLRASPQWRAGIDVETAVVTLSYEDTFSESTGWGVSVPLVTHMAGFLDEPLEEYHQALGLDNYDYGRSLRPMDSMLLDVRYGGRSLIVANGTASGFGDARLWVRQKIVDSGAKVALEALVEFPTGDASRGMGDGSYDYALSALADIPLSEALSVALTGGYVFLDKYKGASVTVPLRDIYYAGAELRWRAWRRTSLIAQLTGARSPYGATGIDVIDRDSLILTLGMEHTGADGGSTQLSVTEDPNTSGAPDFIVSMGYRKGF